MKGQRGATWQCPKYIPGHGSLPAEMVGGRLTSYVIVGEGRIEVSVRWLGGPLLSRAQPQKQWKKIIWLMICVWHIVMIRNLLGRPLLLFSSAEPTNIIEMGCCWERWMFVKGT